MAREVKILVKNVYVSTEFKQFIVEESVLVKALKERIHDEFPGTPLPAHQKLIFGGKICEDSDALQKILNVNQVQSEDSVDDATAVVFHLLVTSALPKSRPSTPPARAASPRISVEAANAVDQQPPQTAAAANHTPAGISSADRATIDSPRPTLAASAGSPPAFTINTPAAAAQPAPFTFPAFGHFQGAHAPPGSEAAAAHPPQHHAAHAPQQQQHDLYTQGMLMHHQAMVLAQIQYLQHLKTHYESVGAQQHNGQHAPGAVQPTGTQSIPAAAHPQQQQQQMPLGQPHPFAHYAQYGNYFGMGLHHPQAYNAMHHPGGAHPMGPAAAGMAAGFPGATTIPPAAAAPTRRNAVVVQMAREILPLFDLRLAMKMAFMLFIIGQDTPNDRVLMLALLSFISYLHITGIFAKIYEVYKRETASAADANGNENRPEGAHNNNNNNNNADAARVHNIAASLARFDFTHVLRISSDRGLVQDVKYFLVGLLLSLVPAWHPQPTDGAAVMPPPVQDMRDAGEIPVQGI